MIKNESKKQALLSCLSLAVPFVAFGIYALIHPEHSILYWAITASFGLGLILQVVILLLVSRWSDRIDSRKVTVLTYWIQPAVIWFSALLIVLNRSRINTQFFSLLFIGALLAITGNYLPKASPNPLFGTRFRRTLENRQNWQVTNRAAGITFTLCGITLMLISIFPDGRFIEYLFPALLIILIAVPYLVSTLNYKKQVSQGTWKVDLDYLEKGNGWIRNYRKTSIPVLVITVLIIAGVSALIVWAGFDVRFEPDVLQIDARSVPSQTIPFESIESIEWIEDPDYGSKTFGYDDMNKMMGDFSSKEFGQYTLYGYSGQPAVKIIHDKQVTVISEKDSEETSKLYEKLLEIIDQPDS
ncbi:SdpI family protein [Ileibacterium valens]|uniref:SdpI family protein n=1 Tax=Ileibacterium valens TaxID=1862668 RepID=UPI00272F7AEC|nr:SdpI family protein [Ileibacterium valens]